MNTDQQAFIYSRQIVNKILTMLNNQVVRGISDEEKVQMQNIITVDLIANINALKEYLGFFEAMFDLTPENLVFDDYQDYRSVLRILRSYKIVYPNVNKISEYFKGQ